MDTIESCEYENTNIMFEPLTDCNYHVAEWFNDTHAQLLEIVKTYMERNNV